MIFDVQEWYNNICKEDVIVAYKGIISSDSISALLLETEVKMEKVESNVKIIKRNYSVIVEALQNLYHHIEETPQNLTNKFGERFAVFFLLRISETAYKIITGNFIQEKKIKLLKERTEQINYLSKEELKILYKLILNNDEYSDKGGGGLGMIDIARKTGNKLISNFYNYDNENFFFSLEVVIS